MLAVLWVRSALLAAMPWWRMGMSRKAVAKWTTASAVRPSTARSRPGRSMTSATSGRAPSARSRSRLAGLRVRPATSWPPAARARTSGTPSAPVEPATSTFMTLLQVGYAFARGTIQGPPP
jgi:hypothetical protein